MDVQTVTTFLRPYYRNYDWIQAYYREGLKQYLMATGKQYFEMSMTRFPRMLRYLWKIRNSYHLQKLIPSQGSVFQIIDGFARFMGGAIKTPSSFFDGAVGQYIFKGKDGFINKTCIDSWDSGEIPNQELLDWCDIYFKTNYWKDRSYPAKVMPMVNGNPCVINQLSALRLFRNVEKKYDLSFVVRIYTETYDANEMEHNLRLLEAVSEARCSKFVLAYFTGNVKEKLIRRLEKRKIPYTKTPMRIHDLWKISAQSRLNIIRLGIYFCIPWRMIDLICMGAIPVIDCIPYTVWPKPLEENTNFLSFEIECGPQNPLGKDNQYASIPLKIETWLSNQKGIDTLSHNNMVYFDNYIDPFKLGEYITKRVTMR